MFSRYCFIISELRLFQAVNSWKTLANKRNIIKFSLSEKATKLFRVIFHLVLTLLKVQNFWNGHKFLKKISQLYKLHTKKILRSSQNIWTLATSNLIEKQLKIYVAFSENLNFIWLHKEFDPIMHCAIESYACHENNDIIPFEACYC